ncbi:Lysine-specific demethylase 8 [Massospora cicadina]|nr:Lysine-specific demethylase 8 [Massospora cicadina]
MSLAWLICLKNDNFVAGRYGETLRLSRALFKYIDDLLHAYNVACMALSISLCLAAVHGCVADQRRGFRFAEALRYLDLAIIVSGPPAPFAGWVFRLIGAVQPNLPPIDDVSPQPRVEAPGLQVGQIAALHAKLLLDPVLRLAAPSIEEFLTRCWPAFTCRPWADIGFLKSHLGPYRTIPVEVGRQYTDDDWSQVLMTVEAFFRNHLGASGSVQPGRKVGYLAQHDIFRQFPQLRADVYVPDYCYAISTDGAHKTDMAAPAPEVMRHGWLGPGKTRTPLHADPYHNLFAQVVGAKTFLLFPPDQAANLYLHPKEGLLSNTSTLELFVDRLNFGVDALRFKKFNEALAHATLVHLEPGDLLYIPRDDSTD